MCSWATAKWISPAKMDNSPAVGKAGWKDILLFAEGGGVVHSSSTGAVKSLHGPNKHPRYVIFDAASVEKDFELVFLPVGVLDPRRVAANER